MWAVINYINDSNDITVCTLKRKEEKAIELAIEMVKEQTQLNNSDNDYIRRELSRSNAFYGNGFTVFIQKTQLSRKIRRI